MQWGRVWVAGKWYWWPGARDENVYGQNGRWYCGWSLERCPEVEAYLESGGSAMREYLYWKYYGWVFWRDDRSGSGG